MFSSKFIPFFLLLCLAASAAFAQKKDDQPPVAVTPATPYSEVRRDHLLNGFQVVTLERASEPMLTCDIVIRAGAMFDLVDKTGIAALTQATLLAVNPRVKEEFESLNAKLDWGVTQDLTWFHIESPVAAFDTALEIFARLLVVENLRDNAFKQAQQTALAQAKARILTAAERADEAFHAALYGTHPYGHNLTGNEKTLGGVRTGDIYDYLKRFYLANNAFAVVTGPVKHERILRAFKTNFGGWAKGALTAATFRAPQRVAQLNLVKVEAADAANVELRGGVLGVKLSDPDFLTAELLTRVLAARLRRTGLEGVHVHHPAHTLAAPFAFAASVPAAQAQAVSRQVTDAFAALATGEITAPEFAAAQTALTNAYAARPIAHFLHDIESYHLPKNYPLTVAERIAKLTPADAQRLARRLLDANALTVVALGG